MLVPPVALVTGAATLDGAEKAVAFSSPVWFSAVLEKDCKPVIVLAASVTMKCKMTAAMCCARWRATRS